jgi:sugar phosphate isomerase/epimerase
MFEGMPLERACETAAEIGYRGIEIAPFTLAEDVRELGPGQRRKVRQVIESAGLECAGLHWLLTKPEGLHIGCPDARVRKETTHYLVALAELCAELGAEDLVFGSPKSRDVAPGDDPADYWARSVETIRAVAEKCEPLGAVLCMEPLARSISNFLNTAEEVRRFVAEVGHPAALMTLDCYSMGDEAIPRGTIIRETGILCGHVHANDTTKREPGTGDLDLGEVADALREIDYVGWVSLEVFEIDPDPVTMARRGYDVMADAVGPV